MKRWDFWQVNEMEYYVNKVFTGTIQTILMSFDSDFVNEVYRKSKYVHSTLVEMTKSKGQQIRMRLTKNVLNNDLKIYTLWEEIQRHCYCYYVSFVILPISV